MSISGYHFLYGNLFPEDLAARSRARAAQSQAEAVQERVDRMSLLVMALWTLARDKLGVTDEELLARVQELDLSDGKLDGKISPRVGECPSCHRRLSQRHRRCLYCGHATAGLAAP